MTIAPTKVTMQVIMLTLGEDGQKVVTSRTTGLDFGAILNRNFCHFL